MASSTLINYGNELYDVAGVAQPGGTIIFDATGLVQAQMTFAIDTDAIAGSISYYSDGQPYPNSIGVDLTSYKYHIQSSKGEVSMITVDYMGIIGGNATKPQITGISNTSAQAIESHPAFTEPHTIYPNALAGYPDDATTWPVSNNPIWITREVDDPNNPAAKIKQYSFGGFGLAKKDDGGPNIKAGIRQFLQPMQSIRGTIFFDGNSGTGGDMAQGVGFTLSSGALELLVPNANVTGALGPGYCLLTAANVEPIGNPDNPAAMKVVYDIMVGGELGWDPDIYPEGF
jgi:hypothetical protein